MLYKFPLLAILAACTSAFRVDSNFMTTTDLERYFSVSTLEEVPEYEIVDPIAYSAGGRHKRHIEIEEATKEIKLQAFGEEIHMKLEENTQLLADGLEVDVHGEDGIVEKVQLTTKNCFYHGELASRKGSKVAVSTCDGVMGMIGTETHDIFIQPLSKEHKEKYRHRRDVENPHIIYRRTTARPDEDAFCALDPELPGASGTSRMLRASMAQMHQMEAALAPPPMEVIMDFDSDDTTTGAYYGDETTTDLPNYDDDETTEYDGTESNKFYDDEAKVTESNEYDDEESTESNEYDDEESNEATEAAASAEDSAKDSAEDDKGRRDEGGHGGSGEGHGSGGKGRATDSDGGSSRKKRQTDVKYLEVRVLADKDMVNYHSTSGVIPYTLTLMNIVAARFIDPSLGRTIIIHVVKLGYLTTDYASERTPNGQNVQLSVQIDGVSTLNSWSQFQYYTNAFSDTQNNHWDNAILISRKNLEINGRNSLLGIAWGNATCYGPRQASVNQDQGLSSGIVISHEIGHTLGMDHDNDNGCQNGVNVMSSHRPNGAGSFVWSSCSRSDLQYFLSDPYKQCLNDKPAGVSQYPLDPDNRPGSTLSADEQCVLQSTDVATFVGACTPNYATICANLVCRSSLGYCSSSVAAAEGTNCGSGMWCLSGQCVQNMGSNNNNNQWRVSEGQCSASCGPGVKAQIVQCVQGTSNTVVSDDQCDTTTKPNPSRTACNQGNCPTTEWRGEQGPCSVTCGNGVSQKIIRCYSSVSGYVDDSFCNQGSKPTPSQLPCFGSPCPVNNNRWVQVPGPCSTSCGSGTKTDVVYCQSQTGQTLSDSSCDLSSKPPIVTSGCFEAVCPGFWQPFPFGQCSASCGAGVQTRLVWCVNSNGQNLVRLNDENCRSQPQPSVTQPCTNPTQCPNAGGVWVTSSFSQCSATCGGGTRTRAVDCKASSTSSQILDDSLCQGTKPHSLEMCNTEDCPPGITYNWYESPTFGPCSVTCGTGTRSTLVLCFKEPTFTHVDDTYCDSGAKPSASSQTCTNNPCPSSAFWETGPFSQCSVTCGQGIQQRPVTCRSTSTGGALCDPNTKPATTRPCESGVCATQSAWGRTAYSECSVTCGEGVETRSVFCFSTVTNTPRPESECDANTKPVASRTCNQGNCPTIVSPDQGVRCAGLWTRTVTNLDRFSFSSGGQTCKESIVAQPGQKIKITFTECFIDPTQGDEGRVRDGHKLFTFNCDGSLDEDGQAYSWTSENHFIQIEHLSYLAGHGYTINVEFLGQPDNGCDQVFTAPSGQVTSTNYPSNYPNINRVCQTSIIAPPGMRVQMTFENINLFSNWFISQCGDKLEVYDLDSGDGLRYCGRPNNPEGLRQPDHDNRVLVQFTNNGDGWVGQGFSIRYTFVPISP